MRSGPLRQYGWALTAEDTPIRDTEVSRSENHVTPGVVVVWVWWKELPFILTSAM